MKLTKGKIIGVLAVLVVLAAAFWYGGGAPGLQGWTVEKTTPPPVSLEATSPTPAATPAPSETTLPTESPEAPEETPNPELTPTPEPEAAPQPTSGIQSRPGGTEGGLTAEEKVAAAAAIAGGSSPGVMEGDTGYSESQGMVLDPNTGKDKYLTDPVPEGKPLPVEPQDAAISDTAYTCTLSISCATILGNMDWLDPEKVELVPEDGWILEPTAVTFYEGESVFNVLQRTCKQKGIHMEFSNTPMYNSAYIEGIHNLYEFDCGELSGWMYKVDEWFPNYGCSRYQLKDGEVICWEYTCDLGVNSGTTYDGKIVRLTSDIDLGGSSSPWAPIGGMAGSFNGTFDGDYHTISGLYINTNASRQGFFGYTDGAIIKNLTVKGQIISTGEGETGGIIGRAKNTTVINCRNDASVTGKTQVGGMVGYTMGTTSIGTSLNTGDITASSTGIGGLVGTAWSGTLSITDCYNTGSVGGFTNGGGGIIGQNRATVALSNVYSAGTITWSGTGVGTAGGISGEAASAETLVSTNAYYLEGSVVSHQVLSDIGTQVAGASITPPLMGAAFTADLEQINAGYPILVWQAGERSNDASVEKVTVDGVEAASDGGTGYTAQLPEGAQVVITVTPTDTNATVSTPEQAVAGDNTVWTFTVTAEDGATTADYTLTITFLPYSTIAFDGNGGTLKGNATIAAPKGSAVDSSAIPSASRSGYTFGGWYENAGGTGPRWDVAPITTPQSDITLYAKWTEDSGGVKDPELEFHREQALANLEKQFEKCRKDDYSEENWSALLAAYDQGIANINAAKAGQPPYIENNIIAQLNKAIAAMQAIPSDGAGSIDVVVSMDANTLGLGYIIKPTLVSVDDRTKASVVIDDLLGENGYGYNKTGTIENGFYLAGVKPVDQTGVKIADYIVTAAGGSGNFMMSDKNNTTLEEFDYYNTSGWMYSIGDGSQDPSFPGVGASAWMLSDGEVMRWQFTVYGLGADLNADNSAWGTSSIVPNLGDKTSLTWLVAELRNEYSDKELEANKVYQAAMDVLTDPEATQAKIDLAENNLQDVDFEHADPGGSGGGGGIITETAPEAAVDEDGQAKVTLSQKDVADIISRAKEEGADTITIAPKLDGNATKVTVELPTSAVSSIAEETDTKLTIKTDIASVTIPTAGLEELGRQSGETVSISIEALRKENDARTGEIKVDLQMGGKTVDSLSGGIAITVPGKDLTSSHVLVLVREDGSTEIIKKSAVDGDCVRGLLNGSCTIMVQDNAKDYSDVDDGYWGKQSIDFATSREIFSGVSDTEFAPNAPMSRSMMVTVLFRLEDGVATGTNSFSDVPEDTWYTGAVIWASEHDIVRGTGAGFAPNENITREQLATMMYHYAKFLGMDVTASGTLTTFSDESQVSDWADEAMKWAVGAGLLTGKGDQTLAPTDIATRAEVAAIIQRMVERMVG